MAQLPDGSLLVATSNASTGGFYGPTTLQIYRYRMTNGVADAPTLALDDGVAGPATGMAAAGNIVAVATGANTGSEILILQADTSGALTQIGAITFSYPPGTWEHDSHTVALRAVPGQTGVYQLLISVGSQADSVATPLSVQVGTSGLISQNLYGDSLYSVQFTVTGATVSADAAVQLANGLRNPFALSFAANGDVYLVDNGQDVGLSNVATSADVFDVIPAGTTSILNFGFPNTFADPVTGIEMGPTLGITLPVVPFIPLGDQKSQGAAGMALSPSNFPATLSNGIFAGFFGAGYESVSGSYWDPVIYSDLGTGQYFDFITGGQTGVGPILSMLSTDSALYLADLGSSNGGGVVYQVSVAQPSFSLSATAATATTGATGSSTVTVTPNYGFSSGVTLAALNWPSGITATFAINPATASSTATINVGPDVTPGPYSLIVSGTSGALSASATLDLTVSAPVQATTTALAASDAAPPAETSITLTASIAPSAAAGIVTFYDGAVMVGTGTLSDGVASFTVNAIGGGAHSYSAAYSGYASYVGYATSSSSAVLVTAQPVATTTTLSASATDPAIGSSVTLTATTLPTDATGSVSFLDSGATIGAGSLSSGAASFTVGAITSGTHSYSASYGGNSGYSASTSAAVTVTAVGGSGQPSFNLSATSATANASAPGAYVSYGDSITYGAAASTTAKQYNSLIASDLSAVLTNRGVGSTQACDMAQNIMSSDNPPDSQAPLQTALIGTNDAFVKGSGPYEAVYKSCHTASLAWMAIPSSQKTAAQSCTQSGYWEADTTYLPGIAARSYTPGDTLSCSVTSYGGPIYLWYRVTDSNPGAFTYSVDGGPAQAVNSSSSIPIATWVGGVDGVFVIRVPGLAAGPHTVLVTVTSSSVSILAVGSLNPVAQLGAPEVFAGGVLRQIYDGDATWTAAYDADAAADVALLSGDGLPVYFVPVRNFVNADTEMADAFHPNDTGHLHLRDAFESLSQFPLNSAALFSSVVTVTPSNGFNSGVTLAASGWPAGITGTFLTNPATSSSTLLIRVGASVAPGPYTLTVTGTSGALSTNTTIPITVTAQPSFTLSATAASATAVSPGTSTVTVTPTNGFHSVVEFSASNWPAGITATFGTNPTTASSTVTISVDASVAPGPYALTLNGSLGTLSVSTTIALTVTALQGLGSSAIFTGLDSSTQGNWSPTYGADGYLIADGANAVPAYASVAITGASTFLWAGSTPDVRALQSSPGSTSRIASCYCTLYSNNFNVSLNLTDGATHQIAIYLVDWDTTLRSQTITITDSASGILLDSRTFSQFSNGVYGVWNIKGSVTITVTANGSGGPVASGIFFAPAGATAPPSFTLSAAAATATAGSTGTSTVTVTPANGFNSGVTLATSGWPAGITGTFATNPATTSSAVTINVAASVTPGPYTLPVNGTSGALSANTTIGLTVSASVPPSFTMSATAASATVGSTGASAIAIAAANGFNSAVTLAASGWPTGITGTFGTNPATSSSIMTISVGAGVAPGPYMLTVSGTSGALSASTSIALAVSAAPSFTMSATAATAAAGSTGSSTVAVAAVNGFSSAVTLAASGWPTGITGSFGTNPATASSIVTISVGGNVAPGPYMLTVSGTSGILSASASISLTVSAPPTWQPTANSTSASLNSAFLMTDGTVMFQSTGTATWVKLTPDQLGSYVNGTWSTVASLPAGYAPLYYASAVLADGRLVVMGGEYNYVGSTTQSDTNLGAIYDPKSNTWTSLAAPAGWANIGDAPSVVLPNGNFLLGNALSSQLAVLDPATLTWTTASNTGKLDSNNEEGFVLLPDGSVLDVNVDTAPATQRYLPSLGEWISAGNTPQSLSNYSEMGPAVLRPDGTVFATGASGANAVYTPPTTLTGTGTWTAAPSFPNVAGQGQLDIADGPACLLPDGNVLMAASPGLFNNPLHFFEFDGSNLNEVSAVPGASGDTSYIGRLITLPTGQALWSAGYAEIYTPSGSPNPAWAPTVTAFPATVAPGTTYAISGTQFNGLSQAVGYGDDYQAATNYPLVRITNQATGHVFYARTHDHSTMAVATGSAIVSTNFDVPASIESGPSSLVVVANGIPSTAVSITVTGGTLKTSATALTSSVNPSTVGQAVTFTATVTGLGGTPTGSVTFYDSTTSLGTGTLNGSGVATITTSSLIGGPHSITAAYGGDSNYSSSTSTALTQTVSSLTASATALLSSVNPAGSGQPVTFTATVSSNGSLRTTPTGSVTFNDGTTALGVGTLNGSGVATLTTSSLGVASHTITAAYGGDANYSASTSGPVIEVVTGGTPPQVGYVAFWGVNNSGITVSWSTDVVANTQLAYGTTTALGQLSPLQTALTASHGVVLTGLLSGTKYYFVAQSTGANGATGYSTQYSFTTTGTAVTGPPAISNVLVSGVTNTSATITWTTDQASTSLVNFGTTNGYGSNSTLDSTLVTAHSVTLSGLTQGTTYDFDVVSANAGAMSSTSGNSTFTTTSVVSSPPVISNVATTNLTSTSATVTWTTDEPSSSQVSYGVTNGYGSSSTLDATLVTTHSVTLTGLASGTLYDFDVTSANAAAQSSTSGNSTFSTLASNATPPNVGYVAFWGINNTGITISWSTDVPANTQLAYGTTMALGQLSPLQTAMTNSHGVVLTTLNPGTTYYFVAQSTGADGATGYSTTYSFKTTGTQTTPPPVISNVLVSSVTNTTAIVTWTTDQAASSQVSYGVSTTYSNSTTLDPTLVTSHSVLLTGLTPGTTYDFDVMSANSAGISATSSNGTFLTTGTALGPAISNVSSSGVTSGTATITWTTDQAATSAVNYGTTTGYGSTASAAGLATTHSVMLTGLTPNTTYNFDVVSANAGNTSSTSGNFTFKTSSNTGPPPVLSYLAFWGVSSSGVTISWSTDVPANTAVAYGTTNALGQLSPVQTALTNSHGVILTGLSGGTTYYFVAQSADGSGNTGYSATYSFTTQPGPPTISGVTTNPAANNTATIHWTTSVPTYSYVQYGTAAGAYGAYTAQTALTSTPQCSLSYVPSGTVHYQLVSTDASGNQVVTPDATFVEP
jgi:hypothetical protein